MRPMNTWTQKDVDAVTAAAGMVRYYPPNTTFAAGIRFHADSRFGPRSSFTANSSFGDRCTFDRNCQFDENCNFGESCRFSEWSTFHGSHTFEAGYVPVMSGVPFTKYCGFGSRRGSELYAWHFVNGVYIRAGCFFGRLSEFKKAVLEEHGRTSDYLLLIPVIREKHQRLVRMAR